LTNIWNNIRQYIQSKIERKLQRDAREKYQNLDRKLNKLTQTQTKTPKQKHHSYPRVVNNTSIFSKSEMALLQKGLKYNLHNKQKTWIQNLVLKAETAISKLPTSDRDVYRKLIAERIKQQPRFQPQHNLRPE
jgi:K+ transporter